MENYKDQQPYSEEIMVVDDSKLNLKLMSDILVESGYRVKLASDGAAALRMIKIRKPDLILLDVNMPGISGYELCRILKADENNCDIPVIFVSALNESDDKIIGFNAGGVDFISKPFNPKEVLVRVKTHLNLISLQRQLIAKNIELENALKSLKEIQVRLVQEDRMASIGQLSAGIAHEINNPLGFVVSNVNTLRKYTGKLKEYIFEYKKLKNNLEKSSTKLFIKEIEKINILEDRYKIDYIMSDLEELYDDTDVGLERIKKIIVTLKNFIHESNSNYFEDYNLNQGIQDTLEIAKNEFDYDITIKTKFDKNIKLIKANPGEINQALLNILINSFQSIMKRYDTNTELFAQIDVVTWEEEKFVYCSIEDNGIGIIKENISKIFSPFFTTNPVGKGVGLGLSISYDIIVNKHKGNINVESELNKKTKFTISIPINEVKSN